MTKKEKKLAATAIVIAICFLAVFFGYKVARGNNQKAAEVAPKATVTADFSQAKRQQLPQPSTVMAEKKAPKSPVVESPVAPVVDTVDMTQVMSVEELAENTTVVNGGEEADNTDAEDIIPADYETPEEKEAEREAEKAEIEAEKEAEVEVKDDEVIEVPQNEEENKKIEDIVDENGDVVDDTEEAVEDYEPSEESAICDCDSDDHNHVVVVEGDFEYIFCDKVEEIKVIDGVKYMPWIYFGFENEAEYVATQVEVVEAEEEVVDVIVEAEEVKTESTAANEAEVTADACEVVEDDAIEFYAEEEIVEAEKVEDDVILSVVDCNN